jgi:Ca2+-binding RTX toxin-like protein
VTLQGATRDDRLIGYSAADTIDGRGGNDKFVGGIGDDTIVCNPSDGNDVVVPDLCNSGSNTFEFSADAVDMTFSKSWLGPDTSINGSSDHFSIPGRGFYRCP